jgi:hypothetical protein
MTYKETMHSADPHHGAALNQPRLSLNKGHVTPFGDQLAGESAMGLDLALITVTATWLCDSLPMLQRTPTQADRTRYADTRAGRSCIAAQAAVNGDDNSVLKIL